MAADGHFPVAVLGEALIDRFPDGDVIGGAPFNVGRNLALLGARTLMITRVGEDALGASIEADFRAHGLALDGLQHDAAHPTGTVAVHMDGTHHRFEIGPDAAWDHLDPATTAAAIRAAAPALTYFGTLGQRAAGSREAIRAGLAASAAVPFLDLNLRDGPDNRGLAEASLTLAAQVKVNDDELDQLLGWFGDAAAAGGPAGAAPWSAEYRRAVEALAGRFGLQRLTITRGGAGWSAFDVATARWFDGRAPAATLRDTVGAGDAFSSVLLLGETLGWPLETTLARASAHASAVCEIHGAVDPSGAIYARACRDWGLPARDAAR